MFRRNFVKIMVGIITLPLIPFSKTKKKIEDKLYDNPLIKKLLKDKKDFSITCEDGSGFNIVRRKNHQEDWNLTAEFGEAFENRGEYEKTMKPCNHTIEHDESFELYNDEYSDKEWKKIYDKNIHACKKQCCLECGAEYAKHGKIPNLKTSKRRVVNG